MKLKKIISLTIIIFLLLSFGIAGCKDEPPKKVMPLIVLIYDNGYINRKEDLPSDNFFTFKYDGESKEVPRAMLEYDGELIEAEFNITYEDEDGRLFNYPAPIKIGQYSALYTFAGNDRFFNASRKFWIIIEI